MMGRGHIFCGVTVFVLFLCCLQTAAQDRSSVHSAAMKHGEKVAYDIYFKWGLIMSRAGDAAFSYNRDQSVDKASSCYRMQFKSTKFFDNFFKIRDTLNTYYNDSHELVYSQKNTDEGGYYSVDKLTFTYGGENTKIHSLRYTPSRVRIDTVLTVEGDVADLLGAIYYLRGLDRTKLYSGNTYPLTVAIGRDLVRIQFTYQNQAIVEYGKAKYSTRYFIIDIYDEAFESTKTSAEVWVGDDDNFLPVKVRSKLKIGYVEVYYKESSGLSHPLKCRIAM
ncbi:MAG: DUF3108 domain-containing protein [Tannerella sp.]|jgi:hypothetical protein|nr:DUF3108 domain-containing protein [Tannerella sp.]